MKPWKPSRIYVEHSEIDTPLVRRLQSRLPEIPLQPVDDLRSAEPDRFDDGKQMLVAQRHRGTFLQHCPAGTSGLVCCNYLVMNFGSNCPYDCSYCFLQEYLANNPALKVFTNAGDGLTEVDTVLRARPERTFRIGTGELADSLALDHLTDLSCELVPFFAERSNAILELKTKSNVIDNLLRLDPKDRVVVSWSVNSAVMMREEEPGSASLDERLAAAAEVQAAGYKIGFHFDPLVAHDGWEEAYRDTVTQIFRRLDTRRVAWVSLGSLRLTSQLKALIRQRPQVSRTALTELVVGDDGKERVWRGLRVKMYRRMLQWLRDVDSCLPLYICMEPASVWEKTFGMIPSDRQVAQRLVGAEA
ncbi:MAG: radical SAM protein [Deltaproteobacteria bacterium]|nr:radical SAM protein [Deltaproteobacteria bacterium]